MKKISAYQAVIFLNMRYAFPIVHPAMQLILRKLRFISRAQLRRKVAPRPSFACTYLAKLL